MTAKKKHNFSEITKNSEQRIELTTWIYEFRADVRSDRYGPKLAFACRHSFNDRSALRTNSKAISVKENVSYGF